MYRCGYLRYNFKLFEKKKILQLKINKYFNNRIKDKIKGNKLKKIS